MTEVAFWPQRAPQRRRFILTSLIALAVLLVALGPRAIVDLHDLRCPLGSAVRAVGIAYWSVVCTPGYPGPTSTPVSRYVGLFLTNIDVRIFDADLIGETLHGPAINVRVR